MIQSLLNTIAPDDCLSCGVEGSILCEWCRLEMEPIPSRCFRCHAQTDDFETCASCKKQTNLKRVMIVQEYKGLAKDLVRSLKYDCKRQASKPIAAAIYDSLPYLPSVDFVTNVPTAPERRRQRGFDHTAHIAKEVARLQGGTFREVLTRLNNTHQVGSKRKDRISQAEGSYDLKPYDISGKEILLIDDVITTGATLEASTRLLKKAGAKRVHIAVFAYSK